MERFRTTPACTVHNLAKRGFGRPRIMGMDFGRAQTKENAVQEAPHGVRMDVARVVLPTPRVAIVEVG
jgi:hypothetical protein